MRHSSGEGALIAVVGAGALGLYYGARLGLAGLDVRFLMRSDFAAVRERGSIIVHLASRTLELKPAAVFASPNEIGPVDLVLVATKTTGNAELPALVAPPLGPATGILTFQNGLGSDRLLADKFGAERVMGGLAHMGANRIGPGVVRCIAEGELTVGEFGRPASDRLRAIAASFVAAGVKTRVAESLATAQWQKLMWNIPFNGLAITAGGVSTDRITGDPGLAAEAQELMKEVQRAAGALGHSIPDDYRTSLYAGTERMPPYKPSSLLDYQAGRPVEVESIWGEPLRQAETVGAACPRLKRLYLELHALTSKKE